MNAPALVRLAVGTYFRTLGWGASRALRVLRVEDLTEELRRQLGVTELERRLDRLPAPANGHDADRIAVLKERGAELLAGGAEADDDAHPAYQRILTSMAPDEARILRLIAVEGARAAVDVRTRRTAGSELVAPGLSTIGQDAGCRHLDRVPAYLDNLERLGLIRFSHEALDDPSAYRALEAQPEVAAALERAGRARTVRRSVRMTPFGCDFCDTCLPLDTAGFLALKDEITVR